MGLGTSASPRPLATPPSPAGPRRALFPIRPALCLRPAPWSSRPPGEADVPCHGFRFHVRPGGAEAGRLVLRPSTASACGTQDRGLASDQAARSPRGCSLPPAPLRAGDGRFYRENRVPQTSLSSALVPAAAAAAEAPARPHRLLPGAVHHLEWPGGSEPTPAGRWRLAAAEQGTEHRAPPHAIVSPPVAVGAPWVSAHVSPASGSEGRG